MCVTVVTCECVCVALVAIAGRRYTYTVCVQFLRLERGGDWRAAERGRPEAGGYRAEKGSPRGQTRPCARRASPPSHLY